MVSHLIISILMLALGVALSYRGTMGVWKYWQTVKSQMATNHEIAKPVMEQLEDAAEEKQDSKKQPAWVF